LQLYFSDLRDAPITCAVWVVAWWVSLPLPVSHCFSHVQCAPVVPVQHPVPVVYVVRLIHH